MNAIIIMALKNLTNASLFVSDLQIIHNKYDLE